MRRWIEKKGGFVHEALVLTDDAPCGARGVVASRRIDTAELESTALVIIPKTLHFENALAERLLKAALGEACTPGVAEALGGLEQVQVVAAALAHERALGAKSEWAPYVFCLPDQPPSPWLLSGEQLEGELRAVGRAMGAAADGGSTGSRGSSSGTGADSSSGGSSGSSGNVTDTGSNGSTRGGGSASADQAAGPSGAQGDDALMAAWQECAVIERARYEELAAEVLELVGGPLRLSADDVLWGLGQVSSRSLGSGSSSGLIPYIDLLNHTPEARPPMLQLDDDDRLVMTATNIRDSGLATLERGDELYLSYGGWSAREAWLKFGFVPRECLL